MFAWSASAQPALRFEPEPRDLDDGAVLALVQLRRFVVAAEAVLRPLTGMPGEPPQPTGGSYES
jgi:hypothetical protein